jgi:hypothetical protein
VGCHDAHCASVKKLYAAGKRVVLLKVADEMHPKPFVGKEQIASAENKDVHPVKSL